MQGQGPFPLSMKGLDWEWCALYGRPKHLFQKGRMRDEATNRGTTEREEKEAVLASLYDEYYDRIARYAFLRLGDRGEAEDLAGDVFLKALESLDSYKERGVPMQAWLFKIAHNMVVDHLRKRSREKSVPMDSVQLVDPRDPEAEVEKRLQWVRVAEALQRLTSAQQQVIGLRFFSGLTSEEVGGLLGKGSGAVREMQSAALKALRQILHEEP